MKELKFGPGVFNRIMMYTDIHWGARQNSIQHNEDCKEYTEWFKQQCIEQKANAIFFLGDFFEQRNSINISTLNYALNSLKSLSELHIPIILIIGNHDLYHRHNREIHSSEVFKEIDHVFVIEEPTKIFDYLVLPYLFPDEYPDIVKHVKKSKYVFGHLEFRNFFLTGTNRLCEHGFQHKLFTGPTYIFSGHYHKRQATDNVIYIGNPFGTNYADANDFDRGCCLLNTETDDVEFFDYDGPTFIKTELNKILDESVVPKSNARVWCLNNLNLTYSEVQHLKSDLMEMFNLRELILEDNVKELQESLQESITELDELDLSMLDETVIKLIETGVQSTTTIFSDKLATIYKGL